ncbi:RNA-directed DNA polymerase, eukaryota [Tanacetum coccineum]
METRDSLEKSKIKWAIKGDENSKFFHGIINKKRSRLSIRGVLVDGNWSTEPSVVKDAFKNHFAARFKQPVQGRLKLNISFTNRLSSEKVVYMDRSVSRYEIRLTVWNCGENKSPGPDGPISLIGCVYKVVTKVLAIRLATVISNLVSDTQSAFAASMIGCAVMQKPFRYLGVKVGDFMSWKTAWVDTVHKLLSNWKVKTLSIGVLKEMEAIRSKFFNGADISDRKITWASSDKVLASKKNGGLGVSSFHALNRALLLKWVWRFISQDGSLWFRVIQAVYGSSFNLHSVNQPSIWCSILREVHLLKSKGFDFITHCKKRVGDGHSTRFWYDNWISDQSLCDRFPRLFALETDKEATVDAMLGASSTDVSFRRAVRDGAERQQWSDLNSLSGSVSLSSSKDRWICDLTGDGDFWVKEVRNTLDDLFLRSQPDATRWVKYIPIKINVFAWRVRLDCLPTRSNLIRRGVILDSALCPLCDSTVEDIHHVLFGCDNAQDGSLWFRVIQAVYGSSFDLHSVNQPSIWRSILRLVKSKGFDFITHCKKRVGDGHRDRKITWVKWHTVLAAKKFGGLGVSSFFALNRGLLAKWVWRFLSQDNSLWCQLISAIHGSNITDLSTAYPSTWNSIIKEFNYLKVQGVDVFSHCKIRIGNGLHTRFWKDLWIGDCTLSGLFPRLFALDTEKDISVAGKLQSPLVSSFRRNVRGGIEEQQLEHLVALLDSVILSNSNDRWVSDLNGDGVFRVKDVRNLLDEFFLPRADIPTRWVKNIPIKVNIFAWKLALDRLPTRANLVQRNVVTESQSCPLCDAILEDTSHLFFNCSLARDVTRLLCRWWNLGVQSFSSYAEWLVWFNSVRLASNLKVILEGVFYVTWWSLWNFRNQLLFASKKPRKESIFDDIVLRSFCWCKARGSSKLRWDSWIQHPYLISL